MLDLFLEPFFSALGYWTGKPIVILLSGGRLHVGLIEADIEGSRNRRWYSITYTNSGKRYLSPEAVCLVGWLAWAVVIVTIVSWVWLLS